jgi:hypothetical protein
MSTPEPLDAAHVKRVHRLRGEGSRFRSLPHPQQMLGAPFKPSFGLSGTTALHVPLPVRHARPREAQSLQGPEVRSALPFGTLIPTVPSRPSYRHSLGPVFDSSHGPQQRKPGLGQLEAGVQHIDEPAALTDVGSLFVLG